MPYENPFQNPSGITDPNNPSGQYQPNPQDWNRASNDLNAWKDKNAAGQNINWEAAQKAFNQNAASGQGNYGDWINSTLGQSKNWLAGGNPAPTSSTTPTTPARGNFDLEAVRKAWAHGGQGHTGRVTPQELQQFMQQNQNILGGATLQGEKLYHNGKFIADMIGNYKSGDPNQMSRIFLDGIGSNGKPRGKTPPKTPPGTPKPGDGGGGLQYFGDPKTWKPGMTVAFSHDIGKNLPAGWQKVGKGQYKYVGTGGGTSKPPITGTPTTTPTTPTATTTTTTSNQSIAPVEDPRLNGLFDMLMRRAQQGTQIDRNNPVIRAQADAFSANEERSRRNYLADLAEKSGPNANLRNEARLTAEKVGQSTGSFEGELMGRELQARRGEISEALNSMQGLLTEEQRLALTNELHRLDDATRRYGIKTQDKQYYAGLGQQDKHFNKDLGFRRYSFDQDLGYRNRALDQNDNQFRDRLGFDYSDRSNYWDSLYRGFGS